MNPDDYLRLVDAGLNAEQIALVMEMMNRETKKHVDVEEARKAKGRERWHRWQDKRQANVSQREATLANGSRVGVTRGLDNLQTKSQAGQEEGKKEVAPPAPTPRSHLESVLDSERVQAVLDHRQRLKKPLTAYAAKLLAAKLASWPDPNQAADLMIEKGWQSFEPQWAESAAAPQRQSIGPPTRSRNPSAVEANIARRIRRNEPVSGRRDNGDAELLPADQPELRRLFGDLGASMRLPDGSGHH